MRVTAVCAALVAVLATAVPAQAQDLCTWTPSDLPLPSNVRGGVVAAAGPDGYLAGHATSGEFLLWHHRQLTELPGPVSRNIRITAVNGHGQVVGYDGVNNAAFVHRDGGYQLLPSPAGQRAMAVGINASGDIAGYIGDGASPYRVILWRAAQPGTYEIIADGQAIGIDDAGRVVTDAGLVWSPDGTTTRLAGYGNLLIELFEGGRVIGRDWNDTSRLLEWDVSGPVVRQFDMSVTSPIGINRNGRLATWYFKYGDHGNTLGVWREGVFAGDVGPNLTVYAVTEADELAGSRRAVAGNPYVPATWTCA